MDAALFGWPAVGNPADARGRPAVRTAFGAQAHPDVARLLALLPRLEAYLRLEVVRFQRATNDNKQPFMQQRAVRLQSICSAIAALAAGALEAGPGAWMAAAPERVLAGALSDPHAVADYVSGLWSQLTRLVLRRGRQVDILCGHQMAHLTWSRH